MKHVFLGKAIFPNILKYPLRYLVLLCCFLLFSAGCTDRSLKQTSSGLNSPGKIKVAVSIVPEAGFVQAVAGDLVDVVTMIPPGSSPENYAPTPKQMAEFSEAKLYFSMGVPTEEANILPKAGDLNKNLKIISFPEIVDRIYPPREIAPGERDPHIWMSPKRVKVIIKTISQELSRLDPVHTETYQNNTEEYIKQLDKLDQNIKETLTKIKNRTFIIYHPALGYFADDYKLKMIALEKEGKEATATDLQKVIELARQENIKVIFYQAEVDSKQSRTLAEEINGQTEMISPLAPDYIANMEKISTTFARTLIN